MILSVPPVCTAGAVLVGAAEVEVVDVIEVIEVVEVVEVMAGVEVVVDAVVSVVLEVELPQALRNMMQVSMIPKITIKPCFFIVCIDLSLFLFIPCQINNFMSSSPTSLPVKNTDDVF